MNLTKADPKGSFSRLIKPEVWSLLNRVGNFLGEHNIESYVVGGLVRDVLLGRETADIDIAIAADALEIAPRAATALGGKYVLLDRVNRVARVILVNREAPSTGGQRELDFSTFSDSIEQDLARRDFTINAMAIKLKQLMEHPYSPPPLTPQKQASTIIRPPELIDPFHGWDDLQQGVLRVVADTAFVSDALRLLRAVRLAAELGFSIDEPTKTLIRHDSHLVTSVAGERVREELLRLLAVSGNCLPYLDELGLLTAVLPELAETKGVEQPQEHFWNVFEHSLQTVTAVDFLLRRGAWKYTANKVLSTVPWSAELAEHFNQTVSSGSTRRTLLKLAALLHDIRKPQTKALDGSRIRFLGHAKEGAATVANMLERLRFSSKEIKLVETAVRHHLRPVQLSHGEPPTRRAIYRYFRDTAEAGTDILFLSLADHLATRGPHLNLANWQEHTQLVDYVLTHRFEAETRPLKLIDGHDLISLFAMSPGPKIGSILEAVHEAQSAAEVTTREEALAFVAKIRKDISPKATDLAE